MSVTATVSSKGQITLPVALRKLLGIELGSAVELEARGREIVIVPQVPMSAYYGMLKKYKLPDDLADIPKERDKY